MNIIEHNGYRCIYVQKEGTISSVRIVANVGSAHENENQYGIAHFTEHMFFKGSANKTSKEIRDVMGMLGDSNAYTDFLKTVYYIDGLPEDIEGSLDLLSEILFQPKYEKEEVIKESNVIIEEIQSRYDNPTDYFFDQTLNLIFPNIGHPIAGSKESVASLTKNDIKVFNEKFYSRDNLCFIIVTSKGLEEVTSIFKKSIDKWGTEYSTDFVEKVSAIDIVGGEYKLEHTSEQAMVSLVYNAYTQKQSIKNNFVDIIFENAFGGGMHSMLFDVIREKMGLCYSVLVFSDGFGENQRTFLFTMLSKENAERALTAMQELFVKVQNEGIPDDLLRLSKKSSAINLAKSLQTSSRYAYKLLDPLFEMDDFYKVDEVLNKIDRVTNNDVIEYARWIASYPIMRIEMNT